MAKYDTVKIKNLNKTESIRLFNQIYLGVKTAYAYNAVVHILDSSK